MVTTEHSQQAWNFINSTYNPITPAADRDNTWQTNKQFHIYLNL